jgi:hypothetical protein
MNQERSKSIAPQDEKLRAYMIAAAASLPSGQDEVLGVLNRIAVFMTRHAPKRTLPTQLLALRRYLRMTGKGVDLEAIWSWTEAEAKVHKRQEPTRSLYEEAAKVQAKFKTENHGYHLVVTPVRSLEKQISLWGQSASVGEAGAQLLTFMGETAASEEYPPKPAQESIRSFSNRLRSRNVTPEPTNAAPGTSDHGRGLAVDFVVMKGSKIVAPIMSSAIATAWKRDGWEAKLIKACAGTRLRGPLQNPYESWHWWLAGG